MKILIISPNENTGGTEKVAVIYYKVLKEKGHDIKLCTIFKPLKAYGINTSELGCDSLFLSSKKRFIRPLYLYFYLLKMAINGYAIFIQGEYAGAVSLFLPFKVLIRITNNIDFIKLDKSFLKKLFIISLKLNKVIAPHEKLLPKALRSSKNIFILPNPLIKNEKSKLINNLSINRKNKNIFEFIVVGQLNFQKDHNFLLETLKKLISHKKYLIHIDIYGLGPEEKSLKAKLINEGLVNNVRFMGWDNDPWNKKQYIGHLLTSRWEGYPNVVVEAASFSIPTISLPIEPCTSKIINENNIGFVSKERTLDSYTKLILNYMNNLSNGYSYEFQFDTFVKKHNPLLLLDALR